MKKRFEFEFEDESNENAISFEFDDYSETLNVEKIGNEVLVSGNSKGLLAMAKLLIKMSMCDYKAGFHIHLAKDFDESSGTSVLAIGLSEETK